MRTITLYAIDHQPIFIDGLRAIAQFPTNPFPIKVLGASPSFEDSVKHLEAELPDVVVIDLNLPGVDGLKAIDYIRKKVSDSVRILVLTAHNDPKLIKAAFKYGADGYMLKTSGREELFKAISEVMNDSTYTGKGVQLTGRPMRAGGGPNLMIERFSKKHGLTRREMEVLSYIGQALNNREIAEQLYISDQTVSVPRKNIMRKLGVRSTASLIKIAFENNLM